MISHSNDSFLVCVSNDSTQAVDEHIYGKVNHEGVHEE